MTGEDGEEKRVKPAPYPDSGIPENEAIDILNYIFPETVKSDLDTRDKVPNHDSWVEIVDNSGSPLGTLMVQVKKLPDKHTSDPKRQFKTRHLSYCRTRRDPFLAIVVDTQDEIGYWKHISVEWFEEEELDDQKTKVVQFSEENSITSENPSYIQDWISIIEETKDRIENYEEYQELKQKSNPAFREEREEFEQIHIFLDEYHSLLESDFQVVKEELFPNVWKFGFGNIEYGEDTLRYTLYPIGEKENDAQIRDIDPSWEVVHDLGGKYIAGHLMTNPLENNPEDFSYNAIKERATSVIEENKLDYSDSTFLLEEYLYGFTRKYARILGLSEKNEYTVDEVREAYYQYLQFFIFYRHRDILTSNDRGEVHIGIEGIVRANPDDFETQAHKFAKEKIQETDSNPPRLHLRLNEFDQDTVERSIQQLSESTVEHISKPYRDRDKEPGKESSHILDFYSDEALIKNLRTYLTNYYTEFRSLANTNFPAFAENISPTHTNLLLIIINRENLRGHNGWSLKKFWLKSNRENLHVDVRLKDDLEFDDRIQIGDKINLDGEDYVVSRSGVSGAGSLVEIESNNFPLFQEIHDEMEREVESYLRDRQASTLPKD